MSKETIPHADLIRAALDGKVVQCREQLGAEWQTFADTRTAIHFMSGTMPRHFRIRPDTSVTWCACYYSGNMLIWGAPRASRKLAADDAALIGKHAKLLRMEIDTDTLAVISATTEAP